MAQYYACKFGLNRLRIDGDIRQKATITAIMENVVIATSDASKFSAARIMQILYGHKREIFSPQTVTQTTRQ